jgi:uncharacterized protein
VNEGSRNVSVALDTTGDAAMTEHAPRRAAIEHAIEHNSHYLPTQGPIETFIHHNTLHAFEEMPFHQALAAASKRYGARSYLLESEYRESYAAGRITDADLLDATARRGGPLPGGAHAGDPFRDRALILRALLLDDCDPERPATTRWRLSEGMALTHPGDEERWPACFEALFRAGRRPAPALIEAGEQLLDRFGERSHRDLVRALTDIDICDTVDPWIIRACASQLDEGLALEPATDRQLGLYRAWRRWVHAGRGHLRGLPRGLALPDDPIDAVSLALEQLAVPDDRLDAYIGRVLQHLPGWGGMICWRETHPDYRPELPPVAVVDYLAMRLLGEWSALALVCRRVFSCEVGQLFEQLATQREEVAVRRALFEGRLDDARARDARRALLLTGRARALACVRLCSDLAREDDGPELARAWQLLRVVRALGVGGYELQSAAPEAVRALVDAIDELGPAVRLPIWQEAFEIHYREEILEAIHDMRRHRERREGRAPFQAVFCIDDREEAFRRHLEAIEPECVTYGAGGFFGIPISFCGRGQDGFTTLAPLGVLPAHRVLEVPQQTEPHRANRFDAGRDALKRWRGHWRSILGHGWASLLGAYAVGFFAWAWLLGELVFPRHFARLRKPFMRALLPEHGTCLVTDENCQDPQHAIAGFTLREQVERINGTLNNIGLVNGFARLVVIIGHGSGSINNPHLSAYDCGACGGNHGAPNARLFALMANSPQVRAGLRAINVDIPDDVWFVGGEHNTGNEDITWSDLDVLPATHREDFARLQTVLHRVREHSAHERCRKFEHAPIDASPSEALLHVQERALDPSQARPELGHVTNAVAVFGRRELTRGAFFDRRMFLVSYDPTIDLEGRILERLLFNLGPVGAGISLEYYFSRVDNTVYGAGTKLPHNVVGLVGVLDGGCSDLRTGLPKQMIEIHEPMRLLLVLETTPEMALTIAGRQPIIKTLVVNEWVTVTTVDPSSGAVHIFHPEHGFVPWQARGAELPVVACSSAWYRGKMDFVPPARIEAPRRLPGVVR